MAVDLSSEIPEAIVCHCAPRMLEVPGETGDAHARMDGSNKVSSESTAEIMVGHNDGGEAMCWWEFRLAEKPLRGSPERLAAPEMTMPRHSLGRPDARSSACQRWCCLRRRTISANPTARTARRTGTSFHRRSCRSCSVVRYREDSRASRHYGGILPF